MENFSFVMPAELEKSEDGEWRVKGLASTEDRDQQGEIILQNGIDLTPIDQKKGYFNFDHKPGPENLIGAIDGYSKTPAGLYVEGRLFKNHEKAKAVYQIMSSLTKSDKGRVGLSVEGAIIERDAKDPKIIKKCRIKNVAITMNPVNAHTHADLVKSFNAAEVEFDVEGEDKAPATNLPKLFTAEDVVGLIQKALEAGQAAMKVPTERTGGEALSMESLDKDSKDEEPANVEVAPPVQKKMKVLSKDLYKSGLNQILENIQKLYPDHTRAELWEALKDRLQQRFPEIKSP